MSRVGQKPIPVPKGVEIAVQGKQLSVKGPKGVLTSVLPELFDVRYESGMILVKPRSENAETGALHGLHRRLIANMVEGVAQGYVRELEIQGVGFKAAVQGRKIVLSLGFSSPKELDITEGVEVKVNNNVNIVVSGPDKQKVGDLAARIRSFYPVEPYKGKGVRFKGEYVRRKVGKTVA